MTIIDSQIHAYAADTLDRPWADHPNWLPHATGEEMVVAMDAVGIDGAILVSSHALYRYDESYTVQTQQAHPDRFAIVKPIDPDHPAVEDVIVEWKQVPGAVGIRLIIKADSGRRPEDPGVARMMRAAARNDFPVNVLFSGNVDTGTALIDRYPEVRFVIDHMALIQPSVSPAPPTAWADLPKVLALASRANAVIKVSGACTLARKAYPFADIWDPLRRIFDAWGFERCLWGTDWTRTFAVVNYPQAVEPFRLTDCLSDSERAMLMGGACARTYGWTPLYQHKPQ